MREGLGAWSRQLDARGRAALDASPVHPRRAKSIPAAVRDELVADCARHDLRGIGLTGTETVPHSTVRERLRENRVPTLLVVGQREERFQPHLEFARQNMPHLEVRAAEAGHAVNAEAAPQFNDWTTAFFSRHASPLA
jgi:pimeloyl-ACP methyl ester carboxylesterase